MRPSRPKSFGFTLIEVLIVIALMGILAAVVLPSSGPALHDQLHAAAQILSTDLAYARSLAVTHGSTYRVTFDLDKNCYLLRYSGTNPALNTLPASPFRNPDDPPDEHVVNLGDLPRVGAPVELAGVAVSNGSLVRTDHVEFGPLGETTESASTLIWLSAGSGADKRYIMLSINPVTGLATIGAYSGSMPSLESGIVQAGGTGPVYLTARMVIADPNRTLRW